ncbi:MAG: polysaccharide biosynthesis tyrosine autokinase [Bacteroidaceae bacterium]|nr:polysaccharide biosynthesis tyrosine autokinase [Bacteroidaceae bacterium]
MQTINQQQRRVTTNDDISQLRDFVALCLSRWQWFAVSVALCLGACLLYLSTKSPVYNRYASIQIKQEARGSKSVMNQIGAMTDMGMFSSVSDANDEIVAISSPAVVGEVVKRLHLDMNYSVKDGMRRKTLYGRNLPLTVALLDVKDNEPCSFKMVWQKDGKVRLSDFTLGHTEFDKTETHAVGDTVQTCVGRMCIEHNLGFNVELAERLQNRAITVVRSGYNPTTARYTGRLGAQLNNKMNNIIDLSCNDVSTERAEDFLNTVVAVYNERWVSDRNQVAVSTSKFIDERLAVIVQELGNVDNDISSYKSAHQIPDLKAAAQLHMQQANESGLKAMDINNQLYMARYLRSFVDGSSDQLLPANSGVGSAAIEKQVADYNTKMLQRNGMAASSSAKNPMVVELDQSLALMRASIVTSIDNQIAALKKQLEAILATERQSTQQITSSPNQARHLLSIERQQKVKESLYLYLLQKREENELSQAFTAYNTRVITPPTGSLHPVAPSRNKYLMIALLLGLAIPAGIFYLLDSLNTSVRGRKDLENLTAPFVGEVPLSTDVKKGFGKKTKKGADGYKVHVKPALRDTINEAFRVVRTNLEFIVGEGENKKMLIVTSANPSSGKTFITANLAASLALAGKRVMVVDLDLRRASLSHYVNKPTEGISAYLSGKLTDWKQAVVSNVMAEGVDVLPVGMVPPNPAELLLSKRLPEMLAEMRKEYDLVLMDCPPVEVVADTAVIARYADVTLFVIRAGLMEREMIPVVQQMYDDQKLPNMSVLLNATEAIGNGKYGYHRYGYRYGYNYGYGSYESK